MPDVPSPKVAKTPFYGVTPYQVAHARGLMDLGQETQARAAAVVDVDVRTLRRALKQG